MSKIYDKLLVSEWRTVISPKGFADAVLSTMRMLTARIFSLIHLTPRHTTHRPYYRTVTIPLADIRWVNMPATEELVATAGLTANTTDIPQEIAAKYPDQCNKYCFKWADSGIDLFGADNPENTAIRGRDFFEQSGCYWFTQHPSTYGTVGIRGNQQVLTLLAVGGNSAIDQDPFGIPYRGSTDEACRSAVEDTVYGAAPLGISARILQAVGGCRLTSGKIVKIWQEDQTLFGLDENNDLNYAPAVSGVTFSLGEPPDISSIYNEAQVFTLTLPDHSYTINMGSNKLSCCPEVLFRFPELPTTTSGDDQVFSGSDLLSLLRSRGCVFYRWRYIENNQQQQRVLSTYNIGTGRAIVSVTATVDSMTLPSADTPQSTPWLSTSVRCYNFG